MALAKHHEEIAEKRSNNGARIIYDYQLPQGYRRDEEPTASSLFSIPPEELKAARAFLKRINDECQQRLANEKAMVFRLNKERTRMWFVGYMTKGEASKISYEAFDILDLDNVYGGMYVRADHLFVSENRLIEGVNTYGWNDDPFELINKLLQEKRPAPWVVAYEAQKRATAELEQ